MTSFRQVMYRPRCNDTREEQRLLIIIRRDRINETVEINYSYISRDRDNVSQHTVLRSRLSMSLHNLRPQHVPALTACHRQHMPATGH